MTGRERILAAAERFGWEVTGDHKTKIFTRPGPMIYRKVEDRLTVIFDGNRVLDVYYGPDDRPRELSRPILASAVTHLVTIGQEKRAT